MCIVLTTFAVGLGAGILGVGLVAAFKRINFKSLFRSVGMSKLCVTSLRAIHQRNQCQPLPAAESDTYGTHHACLSVSVPHWRRNALFPLQL